MMLAGGLFFFMASPRVSVSVTERSDEDRTTHQQVWYQNTGRGTIKMTSRMVPPGEVADCDEVAVAGEMPTPISPNPPAVPTMVNKGQKNSETKAPSKARSSKKSTNGSKDSQNNPKPTPPTVISSAPKAGFLVPFSKSDDELLSLRREDTPNNVFVIEGDPNVETQSAALPIVYRRAMKVLGNHVHERLGVESSEWIEPPINWLETRKILKFTLTQVGTETNRRSVYAAVLDVSPQSVEMVYNYHLGCMRTRNLAPVYFGGLMLLGGLGLLMRLGTGVRPSALSTRN
jgi:hypothetical protein